MSPSVLPPADERRDDKITEALTEIDPSLAGLFRHGRELCSLPTSPGLVYLIAHAGRELSACVIRELQTEEIIRRDRHPVEEPETALRRAIASALGVPGEDKQVTRVVASVSALPTFAAPPESAGANCRGDNFRARIANALGLPETDPVVDTWNALHRTFQGRAHARVPGPDVGPLRQAFDRLASLLYGRVGPIFDTQVDVDELSAIESPTAADVERVRSRIVRPLHRRRFFSRLSSQAWLLPLAKAGYFAHPPEREVYEDGSWRMTAWPQGEYLLRMAAAAPDEVSALLATIPDTLENPAVWAILADALLILPAESAGPLAKKLARALGVAPPVLVGAKAIRAAISLARSQQGRAFDLANALVRLKDEVIPKRASGEDANTYAARLRGLRSSILSNDAWVFARTDAYEVDKVVSELVPALEGLDRARTLQFGAGLLARIVHMVSARRHELRSLLAETESASTGTTMEAETLHERDELAATAAAFDLYSADMDDAGLSRRWCDDLREPAEHGRVRQSLAVTVFAIAERGVADATSAETLFDALARIEGEIFHRMQWALVSGVIDLTPKLRSRVDSFVGSEEAVWPPFGAREVAPLLRAHFGNVTPSAQNAFLGRLEAGPTEEAISDNIAFFERPDTPDERRQVVEEWQRSRLRWFHAAMPEALRPLAERLGVTATVPSTKQQSLDETGSWSTGVFSGSEQSPIDADAMAAMDADTLVQFLASWRPVEKETSFDAPTRRGLASLLTALATDHAERIAKWTSALEKRALPDLFTSALLYGVREALRREKPVDRLAVLKLAEVCWRQASSGDRGAGEEAARDAGTAVCGLVSELVGRSTVAESERTPAWTIAEQVIRSDFTWSSQADEPVPASFEQARQLSWSSLSGRAVEMLMSLAWQEFLSLNPTISWPPPESSETANRLIPLLDSILTRAGAPAIAAQGALGNWMERLFWVVPTWIDQNLGSLLDGSDTAVAEHPALGTHLIDVRVSEPVFSRIRRWYVRYATAATKGVTAAADPQGTVLEKLLETVCVAAVLGIIKPGEPDQLLENVFQTATPKQRAHCYWMIYSWWSRETASRVATLHPNLIAFWEWRLAELEGALVGPERNEEVDGLDVLLATPHLPLDEAIRLGQRTVQLLGKGSRTHSAAWSRIAAMAESDPDRTLSIVERLVTVALQDDFVYLPFDDVAAPLRSALRAGGQTRERARKLINTLGEQGQDEFAALWFDDVSR